MNLKIDQQYIATTIQRTKRVNRNAWTDKKPVEKKVKYKGIEDNRLIFETEQGTEWLILEENIIKIKEVL